MKFSYFLFIFLLYSSCNIDNVERRNNKTEQISTRRDTVLNYYYSNGNLKSTKRFFNRNLFGTSNFFYKNGKIRKSQFYDFSGSLQHEMNFSEGGRLINADGKPLFFAFSGSRDSIKIGDAYDFSIYSPKIPTISVEVIIGQESEDGIEELHRTEIIDKVPLISKKFDSLGFQQLVVITELKQFAKIIEQDTTWIEFLVVE